MKSRYSSLVSVKKNMLQSSERALQSANAALLNAKEALAKSYEDLAKIKTPQSGRINDFVSMRTLFEAQRSLIRHNEEWVSFASRELEITKEKLQASMREYEKFHYLEHKEIEEKIKQVKIKEAKDLDEIALIAHARKNRAKVIS